MVASAVIDHALAFSVPPLFTLNSSRAHLWIDDSARSCVCVSSAMMAYSSFKLNVGPRPTEMQRWRARNWLKRLYDDTQKTMLQYW